MEPSLSSARRFQIPQPGSWEPSCRESRLWTQTSQRPSLALPCSLYLCNLGRQDDLSGPAIYLETGPIIPVSLGAVSVSDITCKILKHHAWCTVGDQEKTALIISRALVRYDMGKTGYRGWTVLLKFTAHEMFFSEQNGYTDASSSQPSIHLPIHLSISPFTHLSIHLSIYPCIHPVIHSFIHSTSQPNFHLTNIYLSFTDTGLNKSYRVPDLTGPTG